MTRCSESSNLISYCIYDIKLLKNLVNLRISVHNFVSTLLALSLVRAFGYIQYYLFMNIIIDFIIWHGIKYRFICPTEIECFIESFDLLYKAAIPVSEKED